MKRFLIIVAAAILAFAAVPVRAEKVVVKWNDMATFRDVYSAQGTQKAFHKQISRKLTAYLKALGQKYLLQGYELKVRILDLDLAGEVRPTGVDSQRTVREADFPRIKLEYTLTEAGKTIGHGKARLTNVYFMRGIRALRYHGDLFFEKNLLKHWITKDIVPLTRQAS